MAGEVTKTKVLLQSVTTTEKATGKTSPDD
jgi:hypothetical protein